MGDRGGWGCRQGVRGGPRRVRRAAAARGLRMGDLRPLARKRHCVTSTSRSVLRSARGSVTARGTASYARGRRWHRTGADRRRVAGGPSTVRCPRLSLRTGHGRAVAPDRAEVYRGEPRHAADASVAGRHGRSTRTPAEGRALRRARAAATCGSRGACGERPLSRTTAAQTQATVPAPAAKSTQRLWTRIVSAPSRGDERQRPSVGQRRVRKASTWASRSVALGETCDLLSDVMPSDWTSCPSAGWRRRAGRRSPPR